MQVKFVFALVTVALMAAYVQAAPAPSDVEDKLSELGETIAGAFTTEPPSLWDRFSSSVKNTYEKAKDGTKKLADRVQESLGI